MAGFIKATKKTFEQLGVDFERNYYESETYKLGKDITEEGLQKGVFEKDADNSVFINLDEYKMDPKRLLRGDGTSLYITQDLGTAELRYGHYKMDKSIYVVANEQDAHFKTLKICLDKLGKSYAEGIYHLSYGMVHLPGNVRMRTREGAVVDADVLMTEIIARAKASTMESGKLSSFSDEEAEKLFHILGIAALKYFMLATNAKKKMIFDPEESVSLNGKSAIFILFSYVRTQALLRRFDQEISVSTYPSSLEKEEKDLIILLNKFPATINDAANNYDPSLICSYIYDLARVFNKLYAEHSFLKSEDEQLKQFRMQLAENTGKVIKKGFTLLGIEVTDRM